MTCSFLSTTPAQAGVQSPRIQLVKSAIRHVAARSWTTACAGVVLMAGAPLYGQQVEPASGPCVAEQPGDPCYNEGVLTLSRPGDVVVTATRAEQERNESGQAITVLNRQEIERRQTIALSDILQTTPGVAVSRNGGIGGFTGIRLRGAEAEQTLVVIDGIRVNDPSSPGGGFDFGNLIATSVERVEILRGPNSVPWGSQAIGGVVNIVTADPARLADRAIAGRAQAEYGGPDQLYATAGVQGRSGSLSGAVSGGYLRSDGISSAASGTERDGYRQVGASGRLGIAVADGIALDLRGWWADSRTEFDGFPAPAFTLADTGEYSSAQELYGYAGLDVATGPVAHRVAVTLADIDRDNFGSGAGDLTFLARGRSERYEYQADARVAEGLRVVAGVEHEQSRFLGRSFGAFGSADRAEVGVTSVYGQLIARPVNALTVTGGARYDDHQAFGEHVTLGADAALRLGATTLRASYGEGFKAPTLFQLFGAFGTPTLQPETARSFDLGVEQRLGAAVMARATYFNRRTRNQIDFDLNSFTYANLARTAAEGVELELSARPLDGLTLTANYTHLDARNRSGDANEGNELARRPRHSGSLNADYRFGFGLSVGGTLLAVGRSFDNAGNSVRLDGYTLLGLRAELPVGERFSLYGRVENLTDEAYQTAAGYGASGRAAFGGVRLKLD